MKRIVVVGAGFGGLQAVTQLDGMFRHDREVEILLLSDQNYLLFTPLLPQIASSYTDPRHIVQAIREIRGRKKYRFRREAVHAVDAANRRVIVDSGPIDYDALVLACGYELNFSTFPVRKRIAGITNRFSGLWNCASGSSTYASTRTHTDRYRGARRSMLTFVGGRRRICRDRTCAEMRDFLFDYAARKYRGIDTTSNSYSLCSKPNAERAGAALTPSWRPTRAAPGCQRN